MNKVVKVLSRLFVGTTCIGVIGGAIAGLRWAATYYRDWTENIFFVIVLGIAAYLMGDLILFLRSNK